MNPKTSPGTSPSAWPTFGPCAAPLAGPMGPSTGPPPVQPDTAAPPPFLVSSSSLIPPRWSPQALFPPNPSYSLLFHQSLCSPSFSDLFPFLQAPLPTLLRPDHTPQASWPPSPNSLLADAGTCSSLIHVPFSAPAPVMVINSQLILHLGILLGLWKGCAQGLQIHLRGHTPLFCPQLLTKNGGCKNPVCKVSAQFLATVSWDYIILELKGNKKDLES